MNRLQLEHILRAASAITGDNEIVVIGSQAVHGQLTNLNDLVAPLAGWSVLVHAAFYINDQGVIFGAGIRANGDESAIMLVPNNDVK